MDDALELGVDDNEFDEEFPQNCETKKTGGKLLDVKPKLDKILLPSFDPKDYISLSEAKKRLLHSLEQYEVKDEHMLCSRGSAKSRLGVREQGQLGVREQGQLGVREQGQLGVREQGHEVELMDCSESSDISGSGTGEGRLGEDEGDDGWESKKPIAAKSSKNDDEIPRRPCMKNLCRRLRVKWYENPVKIGRELAERLEEHKFALIIETVKKIGGKKAIDLFNETKQVQLEGGMKICNGSRRRTSGGVFLALLKSNNYATDEQIKDIFKEDTLIKTEALKRKKALYKQRRAKRLREQKQETGNNPDNTAQPSSNTAQPSSNTAQPGGNTAQPNGNTAQPNGNTAQPSSNTAQPGGNTAQPNGNTVQPGGNTVKLENTMVTDSNTVKPDNTLSDTMQTDNIANNIMPQNIVIKKEQ